MPFATFEGEKSVAEIADRLFARMTPKQRETAVAALIRANPRLERIAALRPGVLLVLPDIPALRPKATAASESPDRQVLDELDRATRSYAERVIAFYEGRVIADGPPQAVLADPAVKRYVVGAELHRRGAERRA